MLNPDERAHLLELLRPPSGWELDCAVGTTFSLDLISALMLPLSFAFFDWENTDGKIVADPLALLEALRRYGSRLTIFCQSGQIRLPDNYPPLVTFLEPCIYDVTAPDPEGVFHPKVWALRFLNAAGEARYRVLCLSRNLTFDLCWDTAVALDGELTERTNAISANHPLGDFIQRLPSLVQRKLAQERRQAIARMADELRRVRFDWPAGFDGERCRFWPGGLDERQAKPFGGRRDKALIISPFVSNGVVDDFIRHSGETYLVSRPESLVELPVETLKNCKKVHVLAPEVVPADTAPTTGAVSDEVLEGLHAKLFVIDRGWDSSVFAGSFNATIHALQHNIEFMVELVGKRSEFGVEKFLRQEKGETKFADLLQPYNFNLPTEHPDSIEHRFDRLFRQIKRAIAASRPRLEVRPHGEPEFYDLSLEWSHPPIWPEGNSTVQAWPISLPAARALPVQGAVIFPRLSCLGLTPLFAFSISARIDGTKSEAIFVMNLPLNGAPEDRQDRVLRALIDNRDQLLRYIVFLLAAGDESATLGGDLKKLLQSGDTTEQTRPVNPYLLETMLRALHREPAQLERVESLLDALRRAPDSSKLLTEDFQQIWKPIWEASQREIGK